MVKVSVLMPAYNVERFIRKCIESVISQTLEDIEIICVNDGSTDNTGNILDEYAEQDSRIKIIHKENTGYGHSMNTALKNATGEYIGIVETDDFVSEEMFESLYKYAKKNDLDVAKANYYQYTSKKGGHSEFFEVLKPYGLYDKVFKPSDMNNQNIFRVKPCIWSGIYKRDMLIKNDIWFNETPGASYQDTAFAFKVWASAQRAGLMKEAYLHYRIDNDASSVKSGAKVFCVCDEYKEMESFLYKHEELKSNLLPLLQALKLNTYTWNLNRLEFGFKYAFLLKMSMEFKSAWDQDLLKDELFSDKEWAKLKEIIFETEKYYNRIKKKTFGRYKNVKEMKNRILRYESEIKELKESKAYKIGRVFTYLPSKIKNNKGKDNG